MRACCCFLGQICEVILNFLGKKKWISMMIPLLIVSLAIYLLENNNASGFIVLMIIGIWIGLAFIIKGAIGHRIVF